jgi:6-phosphogluconolactonase
VWDRGENVVEVPAPTHIEPHIARVTMHPRLIAAARQVVVITSGASKADALAKAWAGADERQIPVRAARIPTATWFLDEAAAAGIERGEGG